MADILLKYLTDLPSASDAEATDLMHINQAGNDRSITLDVLAAAIFNIRFPVGKVEWFANNTNPNAIWSGSTWARVPGQGRTIRIANSTGSDVLQQGGSDNASLNVSNIPSHAHSVNLKTNQFDYGTKQTNSTGEHSHKSGPGAPGVQWGTFVSGTDNSGDYGKYNTSTDGAHTHNVAIGAHDHEVNGDTGAIGSGENFSVTNEYVKLAAWYRTA